MIRPSAAALALLVALASPGCSSCDDEPERCGRTAGRYDVTLASLVGEMTDLDVLARPAPHPFTAHMASSYDRRSRSPDDAAGWFANEDAQQFDRVETRGGRTEHVLLDVEGAGALTRIWTATPRGTMRIYLDGSEAPTIEADFAELVSGEVEPFDAPFAYRVSNEGVTSCKADQPEGAGNLYFPIPFARAALVTIDDPAIYYQVSYRLYAEGTTVEPWSDDALASARCAIDAAADGLRSFATPRGDVQRRRMRVSREGDALRLEAPEGGGVIHRIRVSLPQLSEGRLRATVVELSFDGARTIRAPLPELFGGGPGLSDLDSILARVDGRELTIDYPMPFARAATLRLSAVRGDAWDAEVAITVDARPFGDDGRHLHARWMPYRVVETSEPSEHTQLEASGRGAYLGNVLNVTNSSRAWWGEGDERIYVDGEDFPSFFGTGTEDYYGYAWCASVEFSRPYHGQTRVQGPETYGRSSLYRWHVLDRIPFTESLRFDLETTHWKRYARVGYEALHLWYAEPGADGEPDLLDPASYTVPEIAAHDPAAADRDDIPHRWEP